MFGNQLIKGYVLNYYVQDFRRLQELPLEAPEMTEDARPRPQGYFRRNCGLEPALSPRPRTPSAATPSAPPSVKPTEVAEHKLSGKLSNWGF